MTVCRAVEVIKYLRELRSASKKQPKLLVVGAGGIGCELLKNLVLANFLDIVIIDLDTIDVTNLNRQFLFHREHVGQSKASVAKQSAMQFNPKASIHALTDSITSSEYSLTFFQGFDIVLNALDNRAARSHVNRLCLAANVPLIDSGTAGYLGQVLVIVKGKSECYDCVPRSDRQRTFPGCTIRNTPSEPIHCIVWAKHLFNQLFGEIDAEEDISPDMTDPELQDGSDKKADDVPAKESSEARQSTRVWAESCNYDTAKIFDKLFNQDIKYLLSMDKLWTSRRRPDPLIWSDPGQLDTSNDQVPWSLEQSLCVFASSLTSLRDEYKSKAGDHLVWDKDDDVAMNFVASCSNIRAHIFHIKSAKSRFEIKAMAGNIIPAIATTNAIIAGAIVMEAVKILANVPDLCRMTFLRKTSPSTNQVLAPYQMATPRSGCIVCSDSRGSVTVRLNVNTFSLAHLEDRLIRQDLAVVAPDVEVDGRGIILLSSDEQDCQNVDKSKPLADFDVQDGCILTVDDFRQDYSLKIVILHTFKPLASGNDYEIVTKDDNVGPPSTEVASDTTQGPSIVDVNANRDIVVDDDDEIAIIDDDISVAGDKTQLVGALKRKLPSIDDSPVAQKVAKQGKPNTEPSDHDGVALICLD